MLRRHVFGVLNRGRPSQSRSCGMRDACSDPAPVMERTARNAKLGETLGRIATALPREVMHHAGRAAENAHRRLVWYEAQWFA